MKLARFRDGQTIRAGVADAEGRWRDLSGHVGDIDFATPDLIDRILELDQTVLPILSQDLAMAPPVASVGKFIGIGLNYRDHAEESGLPIPSEPVLFMKAVSSICGPYDSIVLPPQSVKTDWEVELGLVIGRKTSHVSVSRALDHVAGYLVVNDVSEREYQMERGGTWDKGKGCDTFGPLGPWFVSKDEVSDPQKLDLWLDVNGKPMQRGSTANMIFSCAEIVAYVSRFMTLFPGDIITTGTPAGVGLGLKPQAYLKPGDEVRLGVAGLGEQRQMVMQYDGDALQPWRKAGSDLRVAPGRAAR